MKQHRETLLTIAKRFTHSIEVIEDGILFDVRGLGRLIGTPENIRKKIAAELKRRNIPVRMAVAESIETAMLLARQGRENTKFQQLPLANLDIEQDTLNVFTDLGLRDINDLLSVPRKDLIGRYGQSFQKVIDVLEQKGTSLLTPNIKEGKVSWNFDLDQAVENFEQLIFVANHGLERLFEQVEHAGFSCEHLDLNFRLKNRATKAYEIKTSFPTLERAFWLKFINLRIALDPPEADIVSIGIVAHFAKARPTQRGLYAVSRPEPESLLLTVNKLKKLVGEENVGLAMLLDQRMSEPFGLDSDGIPDVQADISKRLSRSICGEVYFTEQKQKNDAAMPPLLDTSGGGAENNIQLISEKHSFSANRAAEPQAVIGFMFYRPPISADLLVRDKRLVYLKCRQFAGHIINFSGVWKGNARWWDKPWRTLEWDVEVENAGVYRLGKIKEEWFVVGEYD